MSALPLIHYLLCVCCAAARLELLCCAAARLIIYSKIRILLFYLHVTDCSVWYDVRLLGVCLIFNHLISSYITHIYLH